jgi:hypothetical protein
MCANTKKVLRPEAKRDDQGLDISMFAYGVGYKPYMCHSERIKLEIWLLIQGLSSFFAKRG